jgi:uncharacterized protein YpmS
MMKKAFLFGVLLICSTAIFAAPPMMGQNPSNGTATTAQLVELTGTVVLEFNQPAILQSGSKRYRLMIPGNVEIDAKIKAGDSITVKGYAFEPQTADTTDVYLHVTVLKAGGKEYVLPNPGSKAMGNGMMGQGKGQKGFSGNGQGWCMD